MPVDELMNKVQERRTHWSEELSRAQLRWNQGGVSLCAAMVHEYDHLLELIAEETPEACL
jgi:hypothetical protein